MKRLLVAVLVLAGCASKTPQERPLPPGMVAVATFTAEADPVAGTFTIRTQPTAAGRAQGMPALLDDEVLVENDGAAWFDSADPHGCPPGTRTWGANVKVSSLLGEGTWLSGVYAEITSFAGDAGSEACNGLSASETPEGLSAERGLWSYPTIGVSGPPLGPQTVTWAFGRVSTARVTFSGRIVAAKVGTTVVLGAPYDGGETDQIVGKFGDAIVYSAVDGDLHGLQFVNFDGTSASYVALPDFATAIAPDEGSSIVWFITEGAWVGYVSGTTWTNSRDGGHELGGIVVDPTVPGRAWYRSYGDSYIRSVDMAVPPVIRPLPISTLPYAPWGMAIGPDLNLYITAPADNRILVYTTGAAGGVRVDDFPTGPECSEPKAIIQGPGGRMWFSAAGSGNVCSFTSKSDIAPVNAASGPRQLAIGPDGNVWVAANGASEVARMDAIGPGYRITLPAPFYGAFGVATGGGKLWAADGLGIYPMVLDPDL